MQASCTNRSSVTVRGVRGIVRLVHPAPTLAVVTLSAALGAVLSTQSGGTIDGRLALIVLAVLGSQVATGALNDWADRERDAVAQPTKPIPAGEVTPGTALRLAAAGLGLQAVASAALGPLPLVIGLVAVASAAAYDLWLSRTPLSVVPYLVSFGLLPAWIAAGVGTELGRVAAASLLVAPFAAAAHLANTVRDFEADAALGSRNLAQVLGRRVASRVAWGLATGVGLGVGIGLASTGALTVPAALLGLAGLAAVIQGLAGPDRLWIGMLVAAVTWTAAWALATG